MVVLCCIVVVTGFLPSPVSRSSLSSPPSQVRFPKKLSKFVDSMLAETILGRVNILMIQFFQQVMLIYGLTCCALAVCYKAKPEEFLFRSIF